jgi:hypothetical protein
MKHTFGPVDSPGAGIAVAETNDSGIDMGKDSVIAFHEEAVRGDDLILQLFSWNRNKSESSRDQEESKGQFKHSDKISTTELVRNIGVKVEDVVSEYLKASNALCSVVLS